MKIAVTGRSGFVGKNLLKVLVKNKKNIKNTRLINQKNITKR